MANVLTVVAKILGGEGKEGRAGKPLQRAGGGGEKGYISGTVEYEVLRAATFHCELCGVSARKAVSSGWKRSGGGSLRRPRPLS